MDRNTGILSDYQLGEVLRPSARLMGEKLGKEAIDLLTRRLIESIGSEQDDKYSYISRSAIEAHEQDAHKDGFSNVIIDCLRDALLSATEGRSPGWEEALNGVLRSAYPTVNRIGIFVCSETYGITGKLFWKCVDVTWFSEVVYWHEIFWFIKKNFSRFSQAERQKFLEIVSNSTLGIEEEDSEAWDAQHRRDLLFPASGQGDSEIDRLYEDLVQQYGIGRDHPDFHTYMSSGWVGDRSPVHSDNIVALSPEDLRVAMMSFVPSGSTWEGPSYKGFADAIAAAVRASPDGFTTRMTLFDGVHRAFQHGLLRGLKDRWDQDKRPIAWPETLATIERVTASQDFVRELGEDSERWEPNANWVLSDIADLFQSLGMRDEPGLAEVRAAALQKVDKLLSQVPAEASGDIKDPVSHAINSPRGRLLEALVKLALGSRRNGEIAAEDLWGKLSPVFERELDASDAGANPDFSALAGMYCVNLHFLDAHWTESNFDRIFSKTSESSWRAAAHGFSYQQYMYDWMYKKLRDGNHLQKMIDAPDLPESVAQKALQFAALAYLRGLEGLEDGPLGRVIDSLDEGKLHELCWFFWTMRSGEVPDGVRDRILHFWQKVDERLVLTDGSLKIKSDLVLLASFISELTPPLIELWSRSASAAEVGHHGYLLLENLNRLAPKYPKAVSVIYLAALERFVPDYKESDAIECVRTIGSAGFLDEAEEICNAYARKGSTLLKETYDKLRTLRRTTGPDV
jgi:hypothetical protein